MEKKVLPILVLLAVLGWWNYTPIYVDEATQVRLKPTIYYSSSATKYDTLPLIIALTGDGGKQENFGNLIFKYLTVPARIIVLESPARYWPGQLPALDHYGSAIASFAADMTKKYPTYGKPMLFGLSGGGRVSYYSALAYCDTYSTVVPIAALLKNINTFKNITIDNSCNVMAFHGKKDNVVGFASGKLTASELHKYSNNVVFIPFDGGHLGVFRGFRDLILNNVADRLPKF